MNVFKGNSIRSEAVLFLALMFINNGIFAAEISIQTKEDLKNLSLSGIIAEGDANVFIEKAKQLIQSGNELSVLLIRRVAIFLRH